VVCVSRLPQVGAIPLRDRRYGMMALPPYARTAAFSTRQRWHDVMLRSWLFSRFCCIFVGVAAQSPPPTRSSADA